MLVLQKNVYLCDKIIIYLIKPTDYGNSMFHQCL